MNQMFISKARKSLAMSHPATMSANPDNIPVDIAIDAYESPEESETDEWLPLYEGFEEFTYCLYLL